jgi:hypothetical protein
LRESGSTSCDGRFISASLEPIAPLEPELTMGQHLPICMDPSDDPRELERKIEQANRIASRLNDPTTVERLTAWAQDLRHRLRQILETNRTKHQIRARAYELWEQSGRPSGRDDEFWLQAEAEMKDGNRE